MTQQMNERADYYLALLEKVRARVQDEETARAVLNEVGKDHRTEMLRARIGSVNGNNFGANDSQGDQPATTKQITYLKRLGINPPEGISRP